MKYVRWLLLATAATIALLAAGTASARAACTSSTKTDRAFPDAVGDDDDGLAPDISGVIVVMNETCDVAGTISTADDRDSMIDGESAAQYLDTDNNPATGDDVFTGADRVIITIGEIGPDSLPHVGVWNSSTGTYDFDLAADPIDVGIGGWAYGVDSLGLKPAALGVYGGAIYEGVYDTYGDFAPEPGRPAFSFPVAYSTAASAGNSGQKPVTSPSNGVQTVPINTGTTTPPVKSAPIFACHPGTLVGLRAAAARRKAVARGCDVHIRFVKSSASKRGRVVRIRVKGSGVTISVGRKRGRSARVSAVEAGVQSPAAVDDVLRTMASGRS
jgi:hypothetical protein